MTDFRAIDMTSEMFDYLVAHGTPPDGTYEAIRQETLDATGPIAGMQIGPDEYALLTMLTRLVGTRLAVEVGTFTGTSAVAIARGLESGGRLVCCDFNEEWTAIARRHWAAAGVDASIDLRLAPALETLESLPDQPVDFAFIDAEKVQYIDYYEMLVPRLRTGGLLVADNVLWSGKVVDPEATDEDTEAIRRFNDHVAADDRCDTVMLALGDGVTLCHKR